jgi:hypothetical protein
LGEVSSYWITLGKGDDTGNRKRKFYIAFCRELALEKAINLTRTPSPTVVGTGDVRRLVVF